MNGNNTCVMAIVTPTCEPRSGIPPSPTQPSIVATTPSGCSSTIHAKVRAIKLDQKGSNTRKSSRPRSAGATIVIR
jgi:hypothetical protein